MNRNRQIRPDHLHQLDALLGVHGDHEQGHARGRDGGAAEVDEHEVDVGVAGRDLGELGDEEGVAGDVDAVAGAEGGRRGAAAEFEHPAVRGGHLDPPPSTNAPHPNPHTGRKGIGNGGGRTHRAQQIVHLPGHAPRTGRDVFARHPRHFDRGLLAGDADEAFVEEVEVVHGGEGFAGVLGGGSEVRFGVRGRDDGKVWGGSRGGWVSVGVAMEVEWIE